MEEADSTTVQCNTKQTKALKRKRKKPYKSTSNIWEHFTRERNEDQGINEAICNYCKMAYNAKHGTTSLWRHLRRTCPDYEYNEDDYVEGVSFSKTEGTSTSWKFDQDLGRFELARMIIIDELPFSIVEKEGFRRFVHTIQPRFQMVSRTTIRQDCVEIYMNERRKLKEVIGMCASRVSFTTDLWTSIQTLGYLCLTAHYIDKDWKLHKKIINFRVLPTPHRGTEIAQCVASCLLSWGIDRVCTLTVDNASSNDTTVLNLRKTLERRDCLLFDGVFLHVRCFAHILNLIVRDGIEEIKDLIFGVREYIKYVRSSVSRMQFFKQCAEEEKTVSKKGLCLDVQTRWNSTYHMLEAALQYQKVFESIMEKDGTFSHEIDYVLKSEDWMKISSLFKFLEQFYLITKRVSGAKYVTSNTLFPEIISIQSLILSWESNDNELFRSMARKMKLKFDKYCRIDKINPLLIVAVVLDPRYKMKYVRFSLRKYYSSCNVDAMVANVKSVLSRLYNHYSPQVSESDVFLNETQLEAHVPNEAIGDYSVDDPMREWHLYLKTEESASIKCELDRYLDDSVVEDSLGFDILGWWKSKSSTYRVLSLVARDILAIPVSTVASESAFSTGGRVLDQFRSSLTPKIVESLVCAQD